MFFQEITSITEFPGSNFFLLPIILTVANGIFRWQICYLLLLISNPGKVERLSPFSLGLIMGVRCIEKLVTWDHCLSLLGKPRDTNTE